LSLVNETANAAPTLIQYMTVIVPLITAVLTFILTSAFTAYKERKAMNISKRVILDYAEYSLQYPFEDKVSDNHGKGLILWGSNGKKLSDSASEYYSCYGSRATYQFLVLKNITENNIINVKIKTTYDCRGKTVKEEFFLPVWNYETTLYLPQSVHGGENIYSTNLELKIIYTTSNFETFSYGYKRTKKDSYEEHLKKKYLGFIWITKVKYFQNEFYRFERVGNK